MGPLKQFRVSIISRFIICKNFSGRWQAGEQRPTYGRGRIRRRHLSNAKTAWQNAITRPIHVIGSWRQPGLAMGSKIEDSGSSPTRPNRLQILGEA